MKIQTIILKASLILIFFTAFSCSGMREIERKDIFGRVTNILYYNGAKLERANDVFYFENSFNPSTIVYNKAVKNRLVPYKEEEYIYLYNNLHSLNFYVYRNGIKTKTGYISYNFNNNNLSIIEYFSIDERSGSMALFALDHYEYDESNKLTARRLIEYEYNPEIKKTMQTGQYFVYYDNGSMTEMKTWHLDKKSKKIIEKKHENRELVSEIIRNIEENYNKKARGADFINN